MKILSVRAELFRAGVWTDGQTANSRFFLQFYEGPQNAYLCAQLHVPQTVPVCERDPPVAPYVDGGRQVLTKSHLHAEIQPFFLHLLSTFTWEPPAKLHIDCYKRPTSDSRCRTTQNSAGCMANNNYSQLLGF